MNAPKTASPRRGRPPGIKAYPEFGAPTIWTSDVINRLTEIAPRKQIAAAKHYARAGRVMEMSISPGMIEAKVRGGLKAPYSVKLRARVPDEAAIGNVIRRLREKAAYKAALMFGEIPEELGEIFRSAGVTLSMSRFAKVQRMCGCAESRDMCKHVLAVVYVAALAFDRDPFLLLKLRGLGKRKLITALCAPEGAEPPRLPAVPGECDAACGETEKNAAPGGAQDARDADFYGSGGILPDLLNARTASPPGLRRAMPVFDFPLWRGETSFADSIAPYYKMVKKFIGREE